MDQINCWEVKGCGREPGGVRTGELGVCPAAVETRTDGLHGGRNGGRACWAITGTFCGGKIQGSFAKKAGDCLRCDFFARVQQEEGRRLLSVEMIQGLLKTNCWEHKECGRELDGARAGELGICPAAVETQTDGLHGGRNGGRACWAIAGTFCGSEIQGSFAKKAGDCLRCDFFARVQQEEGRRLLSIENIRTQL